MFAREIYTHIHARDFDTALALLRRSAAKSGKGYDYYKSLAKIATLKEDYREAIDLYALAIKEAGVGYVRFQVYGDLLNVLLLAGEDRQAAILLEEAIDDLARGLEKKFLTAREILHLSKFVTRLGFAGVYMDLIARKPCLNPWDRKLKAARKDFIEQQSRCCALRDLQESVGYRLETSKSMSRSTRGAAKVLVYWPMGYLSLVLRDFEGIIEYYRSIFEYLQREGIDFELEAQFMHNYCPEVNGLKVLSWHTYGLVQGWRHLKESPLPGFFYFDRAGYSGWSEIAGYTRKELELKLHAIDASEAEAYFNMLIDRFVSVGKSKYLQSATSTSELPERYIFIPLQLLDDHVAKLTDWDMMRFVHRVIDLLRGTGIHIVVKRHPKCRHYQVDAFLLALREEPNVLIVDASIHALIKGSLAVCTINSGVGVEALLLGKRVFTASPTDYSYLSEDIREMKTGADFISKLEQVVDRVRYALFMTFYCRDYLVDAFDRKAIERRMDEWLNQV